ncbi:hypothetical protein KEM48_009702 [Puccinia striiformis f. sp. tritici PST-130]|nr:hypothetical protein KEM48_009702 [Puccinia striiformis f. sp. tritici PST-130]
MNFLPATSLLTIIMAMLNHAVDAAPQEVGVSGLPTLNVINSIYPSIEASEVVGNLGFWKHDTHLLFTLIIAFKSHDDWCAPAIGMGAEVPGEG